MKKLLLSATAPAVTLASCLVMFGGVASAQSASIDNSGRDANNSISYKSINVCDVHNNTHVNLSNSTEQGASSGNASVKDNNNVGSVTTGDASNANSSSFSLTLTNGGCAPVQQQQQPSGGGQGGGGQGGGAPAPVTPAAVTTTTTPTPTPAGGMGGEVAALPQQVAVVPTGGVGAGEGGPAYLAGLAGITLASGALATRRLQRTFKNRFQL